MKHSKRIIVILVFISLVGFSLEVSQNSSESYEAVAEEKESNITIVTPTADQSLIQYEDLGLMKASWYGPGFHGRKTANGERFDQMAYTVAHKSLKFGTLLKITNPKNGRSIVVRVNDRGPYIEGRELDLSKAAAHELGLIRKGTARLKVEKINIVGLDNYSSN
ncbi:MAG: septal ring lytic transglycosylase RlpA family protein [Ignavibacterium sp.]|nr:septal ring lytic transglycosylase RlpA family protein [Ignavibacterium sp.]MDW8374310.1 septal ring lytic transglycosylase RlpA family protein [Ignavibacteriales bacterium]